MGGGAEGSTSAQLSRAHALARYFGASLVYSDVDTALVSSLEPPATMEQPNLSMYAAALKGKVCAPSRSMGRSLGIAAVSLRDEIAWITPGAGAVHFPPAARAVVIDLRGLPDDPQLPIVLDAAVAPALSSPVARPRRLVRQYDGLTDEVRISGNVYVNHVVSLSEPEIAASGKSELPLVLLTETTMPPAAVEFAAALRLANRASIFGDDLLTEVAEAQFVPIGGAGLAVRTRDFTDAQGRYPDEIRADQRCSAPASLVQSIRDVPRVVKALQRGPASRTEMIWLNGFGEQQSTRLTLGSARAALIAAHAAASHFHGFPPPQPELDARLDEARALLEAGPLDRDRVLHALRRFGHVLNDGHNFISDHQRSRPDELLPVFFEQIDGKPVVRRSGTPGMHPGDTIVSVAGTPIDRWYAAELGLTSAGSDGYRYHLASRNLKRLTGPTAFGVRSSKGVERSVIVTPSVRPAAKVARGKATAADVLRVAQAAKGSTAVDDFRTASTRSAGPLADLGAPTLYYINLDRSVLSNLSEFRRDLTPGLKYAGLVLDLRGYPAFGHYQAARHLIGAPFTSPRFKLFRWDGPDRRTPYESANDLLPATSENYGGPIALLVGPRTVSAAENLAIMLVDAKRVTVVGRRTASTNGNITGVELPGGFAFQFTGMDIAHRDGSPFNGVGIVPDIEVTLTPEDFARGRDPELEAAVKWLLAQ